MAAVISFNKFPIIVAAMHQALHDIVGETATDIATTYSDTAPRDTGFMASSAYVVTSDNSTYGQTSISPPGDSYMLPEVEAPPDDLTAYAAVAASYAEYPEFGTRFQPPQPAWIPAVEIARVTFEAKCSTLESRINV